MAAIESLYKDYFQKSRIFLYPILEIKRGSSVTPIETYMAWEGKYSVNDMKLICLYHLRSDAEFINFEKEKLIKNKHFFDFKQVEGNKGVYVFDFTEYKNDWEKLLKSRYSQLTYNYKKKIENFYGRRYSNFAYIESYIYPPKYFSMYSEIMDVEESLLREVGELCSKIDFDKETLHAEIEDLHIQTKRSNL
jgi:hypothetical protein